MTQTIPPSRSGAQNATARPRPDRARPRPRILSRDAFAYATDASDLEVEALSDDVYSAARDRLARPRD